MGDSELPPTYYFDGIAFNPNFYQSSSGDYLTATTGKQLFLTYPFAQGTESITALYTGNIDSLTPTSTFNFLASQTGDLYLANNQTSGDLYIGTGTRTVDGEIKIGTGANTATLNPITIGSNSSAVKVNGSLTIGTTTTSPASITSLGAITGSSLGLGTGAITSGMITSSGLITANNGLTVPSGKAMTASGTLVASIGTIGGNT